MDFKKLIETKKIIIEKERKAQISFLITGAIAVFSVVYLITLKDTLDVFIILIGSFTALIWPLFLLKKIESIRKQKILAEIEIENYEDEERRTTQGILKLVTGADIKSTFITPKYKDDPYRDIDNNSIYYMDKIVGFERL